MMGRMSIQECKKLLVASATRSRKNKYLGDAADAMFRVYVLELLESIAGRKKREPSVFNVFVGKRMSEGATMAEAAKEWKDKK